MTDPVTLAVINGRLEQIADEMDATLFRSAFNPIIAEAHDASHGLYDAATGATLIQGKSGLPVFVGAMSFAVKLVIDKAATDGDLGPGDTYIFNDPYEGGTHLSDFKLVRPFYRNGEIFCFLASVGHWHDVGGNVPGNYNPVATESFQEGMLIPPVKLIEGGTLRQDILNILQANSRLPGSLYGDLNGQINALDLGERRLEDLLNEYGDEQVRTAFGVESFTWEKVRDPNIQAFADKVEVFEDPAFTAMMPDFRPSRVTVRLYDGTELSAEATTNRGDTEDPYDDDELDRKYTELSGRVWNTTVANSVYDHCFSVDRLTDINELTKHFSAD